MSSLSPSSSASQQISQEPGVFEFAPGSLTDLAAFLEAARQTGAVDANVVIRSYFSAYHAFLRKCDSNGGSAVTGKSHSSHSQVSSSSGSDRKRGFARGGAWSRASGFSSDKKKQDVLDRNWRDTSISRTPDFSASVQAVDEGSSHCYRKLLSRPVQVSGEGSVVFDELLRLPVDHFIPSEEWDGLKVCRVSSNAYHLTDVGVPVGECFRQIVGSNRHVEFPVGSIGRSFQSQPGSGTPGGPGLADRLGLPLATQKSIPELVASITHVVFVDVPDPDNFLLVSQMAKAPGVHLAVVLTPRAVALNVVPYDALFSRVQDALKDVGYSHSDSLRLMMWTGSDLTDPRLANLAPFARRLLFQDADMDPVVTEAYYQASVFRLQEHLAGAGVDLSKVLLLRTKPSEVAHPAVLRHQAHKDDYCLSMSPSVWKEYQALAAVTARQFSQGSKVSLARFVQMRRTELFRLRSGKVVLSEMGFDTFVQEATSQSRKYPVAVGGPFTCVDTFLQSNLCSRLVAMAMSFDFSYNLFPQQFNVLADPMAFTAALRVIKQYRIPFDLVTTDVIKSQFLPNDVEFDTVVNRDSAVILAQRWGLGAGKPIFDLVLAQMMFHPQSFRYCEVNIDPESFDFMNVDGESLIRVVVSTVKDESWIFD